MNTWTNVRMFRLLEFYHHQLCLLLMLLMLAASSWAVTLSMICFDLEQIMLFCGLLQPFFSVALDLVSENKMLSSHWCCASALSPDSVQYHMIRL